MATEKPKTPLELQLLDESHKKAMDTANEEYGQDIDFPKLIQQVQTEYAIAWLQQNGKIQEDLSRLKLFNNQKRNKDLVGDPLLFSIFQTTLAALYDDKMGVSFGGREEGDDDIAEALENLATYDYELMEKEKLDYSWIWDTCFFGRGLIFMREFDRSEEFKCPVPENIDVMTWLRDPNATSVNGDMKRRGAMRFGGREIALTKYEMKDNGNFINTDIIKQGENQKSLISQARAARNDAQGLEELFGKDNVPDFDLHSNTEYHQLEWVTHFDGEKVLVVLANDMKVVTRFVKLGDSKDLWPIIDRPLYPHSRSWRGTSIPDLTEDKQRQRAVAINLGIKMMKSDLYPTYVYDEKMIKNPQDLEKMNQLNKMIPVNSKNRGVNNAVMALNKATPNGQLMGFILDSLDISAQKATATPELQQGQVGGGQRTLGELNMVASRVDKRYSLAAKIFGWSEKAFWRQWYRLYKKHYKTKIDGKIIRINSAFGSKYRPLTRENIIANRDPDIVIESTVLSDAKNFRDRTLLTQFGQAVVVPDPTANLRYFQKKLAKLNGMQRDEIDRLFPPTIDELLAEDENDLINDEKLPEINANDNHIVHWEIHSKAAETDAKLAHMEAHKRAMKILRDQPDLLPPQTEAGVGGQTLNQGQAGNGQIDLSSLGTKAPTPAQASGG